MRQTIHHVETNGVVIARHGQVVSYLVLLAEGPYERLGNRSADGLVIWIMIVSIWTALWWEQGAFCWRFQAPSQRGILRAFHT